MWVTMFALAVAASIWFSAANLAIQLNNERAVFNSAIESRERMPELSNQRLSSNEVGSRASLTKDVD
jgi:hypothetical protein